MRMILLWIEPMYMVGRVWVNIGLDDDIIIKGNRFSRISGGFLKEFVVILYIIFIRLVHTYIRCTLLSPSRFSWKPCSASASHLSLDSIKWRLYGNETSLFHCVYHPDVVIVGICWGWRPFLVVFLNTHTRYRPTSSRPIYSIHLYLVLYLILNLHSSLSIFAQQWWYITVADQPTEYKKERKKKTRK